MVDYSSVLTRAVAGKKTAEERQAIYDRARHALLNQLRTIEPPLPEGDITRQRLALEDAIRRVETAALPEPVDVAVPVAAPVVSETVFASPLPAPHPVTPSPERHAGADPVSEVQGLPDQQIPSMAETAISRRLRSLPAPEQPETFRSGQRILVFGLVFAAVVIFLIGLVVAISQWRTALPRSSVQSVPGTVAPPKISERAPGAENALASSRSNAAASQGVQAAYLYEENADSPHGADSFRGSAVWRLDMEEGGSGHEKVVRGLIDIPERGMKILLTIKRNADSTLPASHTVELLFDVAPNFVHGSIESVAGVRMKPSEQQNGLPLVGASARITDGYFLIGLTALGPDRDHNIQLLRERPWMDLPLLYHDGRRSVLAIEKGETGEKVFQEAFKSWGG